MTNATTKKYTVIYTDPPWDYEQSRLSGAAKHHYPTMPTKELCALPVAQLAAKDSALFLWSTFPMLPEAFKLIKAWGFTYKTAAFVWIKQNKKAPTWFFGLGFWTRSNAEVCLLATKGHPKRQSVKVHQLIVTPIEQHSKKPDEARKKIVELMGDVPRIELFARTPTDGWDVWGNEVGNDIVLTANPFAENTTADTNTVAAVNMTVNPNTATNINITTNTNITADPAGESCP